MKNKFSIAMTLAVVLAMLLTSLALADTIGGDVVGGGSTISLGTINLGGSASNNTSAALTVTCNGQKHAATGGMSFTITKTLNSGSAGSVSEVSVSPSLSVPFGWPVDNTGCPDTNPTQSGNQPPTQIGTLAITVNIPAGASGGARSIDVKVSSTDADVSGNANFTVNYTVPSDSTAPVVTVPADITTEATGPTGANVSFSASANDAVDGAVAVTCSPVSGSTFPLGTTTVSCSAQDAAGNIGSGSFSVTVVDTTAPVISGTASNITKEATSAAGAAASYTSPTANDIVDGSVAVTCSPASGSTFPLGSTTVTCTATDDSGNSSSSSFNVTVVDTTDPTIADNADMTIEGNTAGGANVTYSNPSASDIVDTNVDVVCVPASNSFFALGGPHTVTCTATDDSGNSSSSSFNVTVVDTTDPTITFVSRLPLANSFGWNNADVTVTWSCSDIVGVLSASVNETVSTEGLNQSATGTCEDTSGNTASDTQSGISIDKTAPTLAPSVSPNPVVLNGSATASPNASDALSGLASASCGTVVTSNVGSFAVNCTATDKAGNSSNANATYTVSYAVCALYDQSKSHKLGSTVPVKLQLCDVNGVNQSSASIVVKAISLVKVDPTASAAVDDSGAANSPDMNFRYDPTLGGSGGGYIFNLSTKGLSKGTWKLIFMVGSDLTQYTVQFDVK